MAELTFWFLLIVLSSMYVYSRLLLWEQNACDIPDLPEEEQVWTYTYAELMGFAEHRNRTPENLARIRERNEKIIKQYFYENNISDEQQKEFWERTYKGAGEPKELQH